LPEEEEKQEVEASYNADITSQKNENPEEESKQGEGEN